MYEEILKLEKIRFLHLQIGLSKDFQTLLQKIRFFFKANKFSFLYKIRSLTRVDQSQIHSVFTIFLRSWTNVVGSHKCFWFLLYSMCKWNVDKRWTKQDIQYVFWNIQPNHAHKMGVFHYEWNFFQWGDRKLLSRDFLTTTTNFFVTFVALWFNLLSCKENRFI